MKGKRVVCRSCKWDSQVRVNTKICPKCKAPVSAYRQPDGRHAQPVDDRIKPTPELVKKRKEGFRDETVDTLLAQNVIGNEQAQAFARYSRARQRLYGPVNAKVNALQPMIPGGAEELPDEAILAARRDYDAGLDAMDSRQSAAVYHLLCSRVGYLDDLIAGLDALCEAYGLQKEKAA
jgi:hypothetical protein